MERAQIVHSDPEILGGTPVFVGTRVPVETLLVWLEKDHTLEEFLDNFPTVSREQAIAFLQDQIVHGDPEIMGGELVFVGTRVPVYNLFDYLEAGDSLDEFLEQFPSVSREQAVRAISLLENDSRAARDRADEGVRPSS